MVKISTEHARKIIINSQLLNGETKSSKGKEGITQIIDHLGYIQIDTISAINRSHHHTFWTRQKDYNEEMLHALHAKDRKIFEYWGHAMSYMLMSDYRYCLPRMKNFRNPTHKWILDRMGKCKSLLNPVLEKIKDEGPQSSKDFEAPEMKSGTWWDWKPARFALEVLFWQGKLMVTERRKFQKYYDLTERVLPLEINTSYPTKDELGEYFVRRALTALGVANEKEIRKFMQPDSARDSDFQAVGREVVIQSLHNLVESKEVIPTQLEKDSDKIYYTLAGIIDNQNVKLLNNSQIHFLSPFDNLIIQRERTKQLFDFDYALECYVPELKRKYGYFVLPILWGNMFVGRLDPKADRKKAALIINNLVFEPEFNNYENFLPMFANKLAAFAKFNDCKKIEFNKVFQKGIKTKLKSLLKDKLE